MLINEKLVSVYLFRFYVLGMLLFLVWKNGKMLPTHWMIFFNRPKFDFLGNEYLTNKQICIKAMKSPETKRVCKFVNETVRLHPVLYVQSFMHHVHAMSHSYMAEILPIRRKTLSNQSNVDNFFLTFIL